MSTPLIDTTKPGPGYLTTLTVKEFLDILNSNVVPNVYTAYAYNHITDWHFEHKDKILHIYLQGDHVNSTTFKWRPGNFLVVNEDGTRYE